MRACVFSDLQATTGHERLFSNKAEPLQQWRVRKFFADLLRVYQDHRCDCLWDLGDTLDDRSLVPVPTIDAVMEGLARFPKSKWNLKIIGNHETWIRSTSVNVGKLFSPFFHVLDEPAVLDAGKLKIVACPFPREDADLASWLEAVLDDHRGDLLLLGHFQVSGAKLNSGESLEGVSKEVLANFKLGLLGHIHKAQTLAQPASSDRDKIVGGVHYVGSPFQQNFGEANEDKRVAVVDTSDWSVTWVPLPGYPVYKTVNFQDFLRVPEDSEDRLKVILTSPAESTQFYAHPLSGRAEPIYNYGTETSAPQATPSVLAAWMLTQEAMLRHYLTAMPPGNAGISLSDEELLQYGLQIATAAAE